MTPKIILLATFYLVLASTLTEGFFLTSSYRKQNDCVRRAPHAASWAVPQITTSNNNNNNITTTTTTSTLHSNNNNYANSGVSSGQPGYGTYKDYGSHQQQLQTTQSQQNQQLPLQVPPQQPSPPSKVYVTQQQNSPNLSKLDAANYQVSNQQQWPYEGGHGSYSQNVQLIPCLCPVNKEIIEQQQQHQQQPFQQHQPSALYLPQPYYGDGGVPPQTNPKKNS